VIVSAFITSTDGSVGAKLTNPIGFAAAVVWVAGEIAAEHGSAQFPDGDGRGFDPLRRFDDDIRRLRETVAVDPRYSPAINMPPSKDNNTISSVLIRLRFPS
jgi:hypothetical protein